jgi:hypothetical protein
MAEKAKLLRDPLDPADWRVERIDDDGEARSRFSPDRMPKRAPGGSLPVIYGDFEER